MKFQSEPNISELPESQQMQIIERVDLFGMYLIFKQEFKTRWGFEPDLSFVQYAQLDTLTEMNEGIHQIADVLSNDVLDVSIETQNSISKLSECIVNYLNAKNY